LYRIAALALLTYLAALALYLTHFRSYLATDDFHPLFYCAIAAHLAVPLVSRLVPEKRSRAVAATGKIAGESIGEYLIIAARVALFSLSIRVLVLYSDRLTLFPLEGSIPFFGAFLIGANLPGFAIPPRTRFGFLVQTAFTALSLPVMSTAFVASNRDLLGSGFHVAIFIPACVFLALALSSFRRLFLIEAVQQLRIMTPRPNLASFSTGEFHDCRACDKFNVCQSSAHTIKTRWYSGNYRRQNCLTMTILQRSWTS
jgi:hypothetical protein